MTEAMSLYCGVFRTQELLETGCKKVLEAFHMLKDIKIVDKGMVWNTDLIEALELENLML